MLKNRSFSDLLMPMSPGYLARTCLARGASAVNRQRALVSGRSNIDTLRCFLDVLAVYNLVWVDPARIQLRTEGGYIARTNPKIWGNRAYIISGDWDQRHRLPFEPRTQEGCLAIHEIMVEGKHYSETSEYRTRLLERNNNCTSFSEANIAEMNAYYERLLEVIAAIKRDGYRSQRDLGGNLRDEIKVYVDRSAELMIGDGGNHRLAIAKLLGLKRIPVLINGVHVEFLRRQAADDVIEYIENGLPELYRVKAK